MDVDWDKLGFGLTPTDYMYVMRCSEDDNFKEGRLSRYANIEISPSAGVLNYGQASTPFPLILPNFNCNKNVELTTKLKKFVKYFCCCC